MKYYFRTFMKQNLLKFKTLSFFFRKNIIYVRFEYTLKLNKISYNTLIFFASISKNATI